MNQRMFSLLALLALLGLLLAGCGRSGPGTATEPAAAATQPATSVPTEPVVTSAPTDTPVPPTSQPTPASEARGTGESPTPEAAPDPLAVDPNRPGFTMDGSPTLGDPDAPIVIVDFSDFQ